MDSHCPKDKKKQALARMWRKGNLRALLVGNQIGAVTAENSMEVPQKIKNRTTVRSSNSTSVEGNTDTNWESRLHPRAHCGVFHHGQDTEWLSVHRWTSGHRRCRVYIYTGIVFRHKKEENLVLCNNMDGS